MDAIVVIIVITCIVDTLADAVINFLVIVGVLTSDMNVVVVVAFHVDVSKSRFHLFELMEMIKHSQSQLLARCPHRHSLTNVFKNEPMRCQVSNKLGCVRWSHM